MPVFESRVVLPATPEEVFEFISRPANLQRIGPPNLGLVFVNPPEVLSEGATLTSRVQAYGIPQQLEQKITKFAPPHGFREELVKGPIKKYVHDYIVEPAGDGRTELINRIDFEPPGGLLGMMITAEKLLDELEDAFAYRRTQLEKQFA